MRSPKTPAAPDPAATAAAQGQANKDAAIASAEINMIDQLGPYGSVKYSQIPSTGPQYNDAGYQAALNAYNQQLSSYNSGQAQGTGDRRPDGSYTNPAQAPVAPKYEDFKIASSGTPRYQQVTELDPSQQRQLDLNNQISEQALGFGKGQLSQVENALRNPMSFDGLPNTNRDYSADRKNVEDAVYSRMTSRLDDRMGRDLSGMESKLANQGIAKGSEAWSAAMKDFDYGKNDAYQAAKDQAIIAGGNEQSRMFGMDLQGRQQGIQERSLARSQPVNELATLLGLGGNVQTPQFTSGGTGASVQPVDYAGLANQQYQAQLARSNASAQQQQGMMNGLFGLGAAAIPLMSDERAKENIEEIGTLSNGLKAYSYNYIGGDEIHIGVMAQEVEEITPSAVIEINGMKHVRYAEAI